MAYKDTGATGHMPAERTLIDCLPGMAFIARANDCVVLAANKGALDAGAVIGDPCYRIWGLERRCPFCEGPSALADRAMRSVEVPMGDDSLSVQWVPVDDQTFAVFATKTPIGEVYRAFVETSPDGFLLLDSSGRLLAANEAYAARSGYSRAELSDLHIAQLEASESASDVADHIARVINSGSDTFETTHRAKDGSTWLAEVSVTYLPFGEGRFFVFIRDIAARSRAERMVAFRAELGDLDRHGATLDELAQRALDTAELLTGSGIGFFHFVDESEGSLLLQTWSSNTLATMCRAEGKGHHYPISEAGVWVEALHDRRPVIHNDYEALANRKGLPEGHAPVTRELVVPVYRDDAAVAILGVGNKGCDYTEDDVQAVQTVAEFVADLILSRRVQQELGSFFDLVPDMVCIADKSGRFYRLNPAWGRVLGFSDEELTSVPFIEFVHPDDVARTREVFAALTTEEREIQSFVNRFRTKGGDYRWLEWSSAPMRDGLVFAAARDVTDHRLADEQLEDRERWLLASQRVARLGHYVYDVREDRWDGSPELLEILGVTDDCPCDFTAWLATVHPDDRARMAEYVKTEVLGRGKPFDMDYRVLRQTDGGEPWVHGTGELRFDESGAPSTMFGTIQDITQRKIADERLLSYQARLRELARQLVSSEERERERLAVELHDRVGQMLAAAKLEAQLLAGALDDGDAKLEADRLTGLLTEAIREVRLLTSELSPTVHFELGLGAALQWLRDRYRELYGLRCTLRVDREVAAARGETALFLFRTTRELLNNIVRHSGCLNASIALTKRSGNWVSLSVRDRGAGFDQRRLDSMTGDRGFGLFSIREETLGLNGYMKVESAEGRGTRVTVRIPAEQLERGE